MYGLVLAIRATGTNPSATCYTGDSGRVVSCYGFSIHGIYVGVWTLQPTAASQKYAAPAGFSAWDAAAAPGCSQATAYLARATGETAHASDLTTLICGLVADGVWSEVGCAVRAGAAEPDGCADLNLVEYELSA